MKLLVVLCALLQLTLGQQQCASDSDCAASECCSRSLIGKKRFILDGIFGDEHGTCKSLAEEGDTCEPDTFNFGGSVTHSFGCPCAEGLECHGESETHNGGSHSYTNPKCQPEGTYTGGNGGAVSSVTTQAPMVDTNLPAK